MQPQDKLEGVGLETLPGGACYTVDAGIQPRIISYRIPYLTPPESHSTRDTTALPLGDSISNDITHRSPLTPQRIAHYVHGFC